MANFTFDFKFKDSRLRVFDKIEWVCGGHPAKKLGAKELGHGDLIVERVAIVNDWTHSWLDFE